MKTPSRKKRIAIQADPLASFNTATDTTLLLALEAQKRGHQLFHYTPNDLSYEDGTLTARARAVTFTADDKNFFTEGKPATLNLATMDVVLLRQDPPFNTAYITTTYLLEKIHPHTLVVNDPASVRNAPEKLFPLLFKGSTPPTLITRDLASIHEFRAKHNDIIIKPLYGHGGHAVMRFKKDDTNLASFLEFYFNHSKDPIIAQRFLPDIKNGDIRVVLIDGKIAASMSRIPATGDIRANFRVGGRAAKITLNKRQRTLCQQIGDECKDRGLLLVGLDLIGDHLIEINITSPTGIKALNKLYGLCLESDVWDAIEAKL